MSEQMNPRTQRVIRDVTSKLCVVYDRAEREYERRRRERERANVILFKPEEMIRVVNREGVETAHSRSQIARATGLSMSYVSRLFKGVRTPSAETLKLLAWYFETDETAVCRLLKI